MSKKFPELMAAYQALADLREFQLRTNHTISSIEADLTDGWPQRLADAEQAVMRETDKHIAALEHDVDGARARLKALQEEHAYQQMKLRRARVRAHELVGSIHLAQLSATGDLTKAVDSIYKGLLAEIEPTAKKIRPILLDCIAAWALASEPEVGATGGPVMVDSILDDLFPRPTDDEMQGRVEALRIRTGLPRFEVGALENLDKLDQANG